MLCKWNHTVCNLFRLSFFTQHNVLEIHQNLYTYQRFVPACCFLFLFIIGPFICATICLSFQSLKKIWLVSNFWLLQIKLLWTFMYRFVNEHKFISLRKMPRSRIVESCKCIFNFIKDRQPFFKWLYLSQQMYEKFSCSTYLSALSTVSILL